MQARCVAAVVDGLTVVSLIGEVDIANAAVVSGFLRGVIDRAQAGVRLDLAALTFIDGRGLWALLAAVGYAARRHVPLTVVRVPAQVQQMIDITRSGPLLTAAAGPAR